MIVAEVGTIHDKIELIVYNATVFVRPGGLLSSVRIVAVIYHAMKQTVHGIIVVAYVCRCCSRIEAGGGWGIEGIARTISSSAVFAVFLPYSVCFGIGKGAGGIGRSRLPILFLCQKTDSRIGIFLRQLEISLRESVIKSRFTGQFFKICV